MTTTFRILAAALRPFGFDAATTACRLWLRDDAPVITAMRLHAGFAFAVGRREMVVSRA